jgi:hypothetical protein
MSKHGTPLMSTFLVTFSLLGCADAGGKFSSLASRALEVRTGQRLAGRDKYANVMATADFMRSKRSVLERVEAEVVRLAPEWAGAHSGSRLQLVLFFGVLSAALVYCAHHVERA